MKVLPWRSCPGWLLQVAGCVRWPVCRDALWFSHPRVHTFTATTHVTADPDGNLPVKQNYDDVSCAC
jgi:hypothetical protein